MSSTGSSSAADGLFAALAAPGAGGARPAHGAPVLTDPQVVDPEHHWPAAHPGDRWPVSGYPVLPGHSSVGPMLYQVGNAVLRPVAHAVYRPTVEGKDNVPRRGGVILASNHLSFIDSFAIPLAAPRKVHFLAKAEYFTGEGLSGRVRKEMFSSIGAVPVDRHSPSAAQDSLHAGLEILRAGDAFGIYPEGTRSRDGRLYRGRAGVAWLALQAKVPVVPVGLVGTDRIQPIGAKFPKLAEVTVRFGRPIQPTAFASMPAGKGRRLLTDEIMDAIAALSGQERADSYNELPPESTGSAIGI